MALIEFNDDVGGRHPWGVQNTQRSEVKTPYCKVVVYESPSRAHNPRPNRNINIILTTTYVESTAASASALLIIWSFTISIAVRIQKITGKAKPRVYYC